MTSKDNKQWEFTMVSSEKSHVEELIDGLTNGKVGITRPKSIKPSSMLGVSEANMAVVALEAITLDGYSIRESIMALFDTPTIKNSVFKKSEIVIKRSDQSTSMFNSTFDECTVTIRGKLDRTGGNLFTKSVVKFNSEHPESFLRTNKFDGNSVVIDKNNNILKGYYNGRTRSYRM